MGTTKKTPPVDVVVSHGVYPSGTGYLLVSAGDRILGHVHRRDGGFVRFGGRKPLPLKEAVRDVIRDCLRRAEQQVTFFSSLIELPVNVVAAVDDPIAVSNTGTLPTRDGKDSH